AQCLEVRLDHVTRAQARGARGVDDTVAAEGDPRRPGQPGHRPRARREELVAEQPRGEGVAADHLAGGCGRAPPPPRRPRAPAGPGGPASPCGPGGPEGPGGPCDPWPAGAPVPVSAALAMAESGSLATVSVPADAASAEGAKRTWISQVASPDAGEVVPVH